MFIEKNNTKDVVTSAIKLALNKDLILMKTQKRHFRVVVKANLGKKFDSWRKREQRKELNKKWKKLIKARYLRYMAM